MSNQPNPLNHENPSIIQDLLSTQNFLYDQTVPTGTLAEATENPQLAKNVIDGEYSNPQNFWWSNFSRGTLFINFRDPVPNLSGIKIYGTSWPKMGNFDITIFNVHKDGSQEYLHEQTIAVPEWDNINVPPLQTVNIPVGTYQNLRIDHKERNPNSNLMLFHEIKLVYNPIAQLLNKPKNF